MRSASEPAIDSVPDENICEVKEKKTLCVEIAPITNRGSSTIDFEKVDAFRDVPTSLRLCVEQGEIPSSPMTQAKEAAWCRKFDKRGDRCVPERSMSEAQYVVSCDEDSVVLMENKLVHGKKTTETHCKTENKRASELERISKKTGNGSGSNSGKRVETKTPVKKYVLKEHEDSIVIEDTACDDSRNNCGRKKGCEKGKVADNKNGESSKETSIGRSKGKLKSSTVQDCTEAKVHPASDGKNIGKAVETTAELNTSKEDIESSVDVNVSTKETDKYKSPVSDSIDDFSSIKFHIVDSPCCNKDITPVQSDEDIEHIQSSEIIQLQQAECGDSDRCIDVISCAGSSPIMQRKNSKNTISDDDLEYIHSSELVETPDKSGKDDMKLDIDKGSDRSKCTSSDDDLEHVHASDICIPPCEEGVQELHEGSRRKSEEIVPEEATKSNGTKKTKDIVVIEDDTSAAGVTVVFKPVDAWKAKGTEKKEEPEDVIYTKDVPVSESPSPSKKSKVRPAKVSPSNVAPKRSQAGIEIIDIDAMQKAEMEVLTDAAPAPECKILSAPEVCGTTSLKFRKNRRTNPASQSEPSRKSSSKNKCVSPMVEQKTQKEDNKVEEPVDSIEVSTRSPLLDKIESLKKKIQDTSSRKSLNTKDTCSEAVDKPRDAVVSEWDTEEQTAKVSWSSIVRKKNSLSAEREIKKELEVASIVEASKPEEIETRKTDETSTCSAQLTEKFKEPVTETYAEEAASRTAEVSWRSSGKKKPDTSSECVTRKKGRRKVHPSVDTVARGQETQSLNTAGQLSENSITPSIDENASAKVSNSTTVQSSNERTVERSSKLEARSEVVECSESNNWNVEPVLVDTTFTKDGSSEPERDIEPEKKSDSEQEIVPERSSSSDELNANVAFQNNEGDSAGRETVEAHVADCTTSVACVTSKKGNRLKKKKRR